MRNKNNKSIPHTREKNPYTFKAVKEDVSERVVIDVTRIKAVWDAREDIIEIGVDRRVKGIKEMESVIRR